MPHLFPRPAPPGFALLPALPVSLALSLLVAFTPLPSRAASTAPLEVSSTVTPAACTPSLSNGGVADYGVMSASLLRRGQITPLQATTLSFEINCDVAARFSVRLFDNRSGSVVQRIVASGSGNGTLDDDYNFGLGTSGGRRLGGYAILFLPTSFTGDYQPVQLLESIDGSIWNSANGFGSKRMQIAWGRGDGNSVQAYKAVSGQLSVQPYLDKRENLPQYEEIVLDGAATLELVYL